MSSWIAELIFEALPPSTKVCRAAFWSSVMRIDTGIDFFVVFILVPLMSYKMRFPKCDKKPHTLRNAAFYQERSHNVILRFEDFACLTILFIPDNFLSFQVFQNFYVLIYLCVLDAARNRFQPLLPVRERHQTKQQQCRYRHSQRIWLVPVAKKIQL